MQDGLISCPRMPAHAHAENHSPVWPMPFFA
jgi:hypothetical protein